MQAIAEAKSVQHLDIALEEKIAAPVEIVWESILEQIGPASEMGPNNPMPMKLEAWPGGRWFRDLGNNTGHLWAHVQVIKPPMLLELCGPMFMSYAATSHVQYRLKAEGAVTRLTMKHTAIGLIPKEHRENVNEGWGEELKKIRELAEKRAGAKRGR